MGRLTYRQVVGMIKQAAESAIGARHPRRPYETKRLRGQADQPINELDEPATGMDADMRRQDAQYDLRNPNNRSLRDLRAMADMSRKIYRKELLDKALNPAGVAIEQEGSPRLQTNGTWGLPAKIRTWDPLRRALEWKSELGKDTAKYNMARQLANPGRYLETPTYLRGNEQLKARLHELLTQPRRPLPTK